MAVQISRREVFNNIIRFKDNLLERRQDGAAAWAEERSYPVLLNKRTGDIRFTQKIESIEHKIPRKGKSSGSPADWKEIQIDVKMKNGEVRFDICDEAHRHLKPDGIEPLAFRVISETLEVLNRIAHEHRPTKGEWLPEEEVLHDLSDIHLAPLASRIDDLPGWLGSVPRIDAEKILENRPNGTYLLRKADPDTVAIAFHLSEENRMTVEPYVCTVVESHEKISDILLLRTDRGWTEYKDEPNLLAPIYIFHASPQGLLLQLNCRVKHPLQ